MIFLAKIPKFENGNKYIGIFFYFEIVLTYSGFARTINIGRLSFSFCYELIFSIKSEYLFIITMKKLSKI